MPATEAWLRGPLPDVHPFLAPVLRTLEQTREEIAELTGDLSDQEVWSRPHGMTPVGYHIRHIGGSIDRLLTYAAGGQLSDEQMHAMRVGEAEAKGSVAELIAELNAAIGKAEETVRRVDVNSLADSRGVGRKQLPTTVMGLLTHVAEHTLRHVGQAVTTAKLVRAVRAEKHGS